MEKKKNTEEINIYTEEGEITFGGLFRFLKKTFLRTLIYLIVALIAVSAVYSGVKYGMREEYGVSAKIEYKFKEISSGKNPDGSVFDKEEIRSVNYIREAAQKAELTEKILAAGNDISNLRSALSVSPIMPEAYIKAYNDLVASGVSSVDAYAQLSQSSFYPTQFIIKLGNFETLGLNKNEAETFLDNLLETYRASYGNRYISAQVISDAPFKVEDSDLYDYADYVSLYETVYDTVDSYLSRMLEQGDSFVSSDGTTFAALESQMPFLQSQLMSLGALVINAPVSKDLPALKTNTAHAIETLTVEQTRLQTVADGMEETIKNIKPSTVTTLPGGGEAIITATYPERYYILQEELIAVKTQLAKVTADIAAKRRLETAIADKTEVSVADKATADGKLAYIKRISIDFIAVLNKASKEYAEKNVADNGMRVVSPASSYAVSPKFPTALAYISGAAVAIAASFIVTFVLGKTKAKRARLQAAETADNGATQEKE